MTDPGTEREARACGDTEIVDALEALQRCDKLLLGRVETHGVAKAARELATVAHCLIAHLRASQPATETDGRTIYTHIKKPAPQPVEGVSDGELATLSIQAMAAAEREGKDLEEQLTASSRALFNLGASRSSAAKDARIAELEEHVRLNLDAAIRAKEGAVTAERERCARVCEEMVADPKCLAHERALLGDAARRIREEPAK